MTLQQQFLLNPYWRWSTSFTLVIGLYIGAVLIVLNWRAHHTAPPAPPMAAMMIELAPAPVAPMTPPSALPPAPRQQKMPPPPQPRPEPEPIIEPPPELPVVKKAEAQLAPKPEPLEEELQPVKEEIAQEETAPPDFKAPPDALAAAPMDSALSTLPSQAPATWQSALLGHLEKHKRYPRQARRRGQEAVVYIRVTINRDGTVVSYKLTQPCPYATLNRETLALINRAQPLPAPPSEITGETVEFIVPVAFSLKS